jgi:hypothetical protein
MKIPQALPVGLHDYNPDLSTQNKKMRMPTVKGMMRVQGFTLNNWGHVSSPKLPLWKMVFSSLG